MEQKIDNVNYVKKESAIVNSVDTVDINTLLALKLENERLRYQIELEQRINGMLKEQIEVLSSRVLDLGGNLKELPAPSKVRPRYRF